MCCTMKNGIRWGEKLKLSNKRGGGLHIALVRRNDEHFINEPQVGNAPKKLRFEGKPRAQRSARRARMQSEWRYALELAVDNERDVRKKKIYERYLLDIQRTMSK